METEAVDVALAVARKLAGELIRARAARRGHRAGPRTASRIWSRRRISWSASTLPFTRSLANGSSRWPKQSGFAGWLVILAEPEIDTGDCRIEWADGGVVLERAAIEAKINELVGRYIASRNQAGAGHEE